MKPILGCALPMGLSDNHGAPSKRFFGKMIKY